MPLTRVSIWPPSWKSRPTPRSAVALMTRPHARAMRNRWLRFSIAQPISRAWSPVRQTLRAAPGLPSITITFQPFTLRARISPAWELLPPCLLKAMSPCSAQAKPYAATPVALRKISSVMASVRGARVSVRAGPMPAKIGPAFWKLSRWKCASKLTSLRLRHFSRIFPFAPPSMPSAA